MGRERTVRLWRKRAVSRPSGSPRGRRNRKENRLGTFRQPVCAQGRVTLEFALNSQDVRDIWWIYARALVKTSRNSDSREAGRRRNSRIRLAFIALISATSNEALAIRLSRLLNSYLRP